MSNAQNLIAKVVLTSAQANIVFPNLPSTYKDLLLISTVKNYTASAWHGVRFNNDSASNYSRTGIRGNGSTAVGYYVAAETAAFVDGPSASETIRISILDYSSTDKHKILLSRADSYADNSGGTAGRWASTAAINTLTITSTSAETFGIGSTFYLYGVSS